MTFNSQRTPAPSRLAEDVGKREKAWENKQEPFVRFLTDEGDWIGLPLHSTILVRYLPRHNAVLFMFQVIHFLVIGPAALELHAAYCAGRAQDIRANGEGITSITTIPVDEAKDLGGLARPKQEKE